MHADPAETLPLALEGQDVAGQAQTGTGKTAAFLIALFHRLENVPLADPGHPARGADRGADARARRAGSRRRGVLGKYLPFKLGLAFGGTDYDKQREILPPASTS